MVDWPYAIVGAMSVAVRSPRGRKPRPIPPNCSPGTTATRVYCPGALGAANGRTRTACGCPRSCCSRRPSRRSRPTIRALSCRAGRRWSARRGKPRRRAARLGGARLLRAGAQSARLRTNRWCEAWRHFSDDLAALRALPGIGDYTAAAIAAIAFDAPAVPVDGNVERVVTRLFAIEEIAGGKAGDQGSSPRRCCRRPRRRLRAGADGSRRHDLLAQAAGLRALSVERCVPGAMRAAIRRRSRARRPSARAKLRRGAAFVVLRADGRMLLRRRPEKGLLASMTEVPGSDWSHDFADSKRA